jgi:hypothetical protein
MNVLEGIIFNGKQKFETKNLVYFAESGKVYGKECLLNNNIVISNVISMEMAHSNTPSIHI